MNEALLHHLNIVWTMITGDVGAFDLVNRSARLLGGLLGYVQRIGG
ncbi:MAG: hypothetical protein ACKOZL_05625 [Actinomycetes bacterium]